MVGLLTLFAIALLLVVTLLTALLVREMTHPPRHTAGYALARGLPCDPGEMELAFESWTLDVGGSVALPVWEVSRNQESGVRSQGTGLTCVLIHGWGHSRIDMLLRVPLWLELCERVVLYDLRGHGEAIGTSRLGDDEGRDLLALIERLGEGRCLLVGHSMGAVIAIDAAAAQDAAVRNIAAVVAYGPYADFHSSLRGRLRGVGMPARPITDLALLWLRLRGIRPPGALPAALKMNTPLLVIHGRDDEMVGIDEAMQIVVAGRNAELLEIAGGGHLDVHLVDAAQHDASVRAFVARIGSAA